MCIFILPDGLSRLNAVTAIIWSRRQLSFIVMALSWFTSGAIGFVAAVVFRVIFLRPSDETLMEALLDRENLLIAVGVGVGIAISAAIF